LLLNGEYFLRNSFSGGVKILDASLRELCDTEGVSFFSPIQVLCKHEDCQVSVEYDGKFMPTAWDYGHLTEGGSYFVAKMLVSGW